jgi:hypothetical protein
LFTLDVSNCNHRLTIPHLNQVLYIFILGTPWPPMFRPWPQHVGLNLCDTSIGARSIFFIQDLIGIWRQIRVFFFIASNPLIASSIHSSPTILNLFIVKNYQLNSVCISSNFANQYWISRRMLNLWCIHMYYTKTFIS